FLVVGKGVPVVNRGVPAEGYVEFTTSIETTQSVVSGAIQIIEKRCGFPRLVLRSSQQFIESGAMPVKECFVITHLNRDSQSAFQPGVEVNEMWVGIIQQRPLWH